jgi:hypothetical protein
MQCARAEGDDAVDVLAMMLFLLLYRGQPAKQLAEKAGPAAVLGLLVPLLLESECQGNVMYRCCSCFC